MAEWAFGVKLVLTKNDVFVLLAQSEKERHRLLKWLNQRNERKIFKAPISCHERTGGIPQENSFEVDRKTKI